MGLQSIGNDWATNNFLLYTVGENVNQCSHYEELYGGSFTKLKIVLPYDPAIPLLGVYLEKTIIQKHANFQEHCLQ